MIALIAAAAQLAVQPPLPRQAEPMPNAFHQPQWCPAVVAGEVKRQQVAMAGRSPWAQYAVFRRLDGCMVPAPVGYHPDYVAPTVVDPLRREDAPADRR